jgi:hypothetical protein
MLGGDEVRALTDWWNQPFEREEEAQSLFQHGGVGPLSLDQVGPLSIDQTNLANEWWWHEESSELFLRPGVPHGPRAYALHALSYDYFCLRIAKDVRAVADGTTDSIKRFIITNTEDSRETGAHWVAVVYEIVRDDDYDLQLQHTIALTTPNPASTEVKHQQDDAASSPGPLTTNSQINLGAVLNSEDGPASSSLLSTTLLDLCRNWSFVVFDSSITLTVFFHAFARIYIWPQKHHGLYEDPDYVRAVDYRAFLNQREFSSKY